MSGTETEGSTTESQQAIAESGAVRGFVLNTKPLFKLMVEKRASDLFFTSNSPIKIKIEGQIKPINRQVLSAEQVRQAAYGLMNQEQLDYFLQELEIDFAVSEPGLGRFRVAVFHQRGNPAMVLRYITAEMPKIEDLGLPEILKDLVMLKRGLVLMVGAAGSGKSTSLAAMINHRNENSSDHVLTIEDPIEFLHTNKKSIINQREVGLDTKSFHRALRSAMRAAPDVILIGEIRDAETLDTALKAADTGHLVFSTLHTTDATQTINRVISFYPPYQHQEIRSLLSTALAAVVCLRLVPRKDGRGRVPAAEVLINTAAVAENIRDIEKALNIPDLIAEGTVSYGMQSFDQSLMKWYKEGMVTYESALFFSTNPSEFALRASGVDSASDRTFSEVTGKEDLSRSLDLTP
jgi:twitching motility protein PilU